MWFYLLRSKENRLQPSDEVKALVRVQASGQPVYLRLPVRSDSLLRDQGENDTILLSGRHRGQWRIHGLATLGEPAISGPVPVSMRSVYETKGHDHWWRPLRNVHEFDPPREPSDLVHGPLSLPQSGAVHVILAADATLKSDVSAQRMGAYFAKGVALNELDNAEKRVKFGLPRDENSLGDYICELNVQHIGGLPGAANGFMDLYHANIPDASASPTSHSDTNNNRSEPVRISKSYYSCRLTVIDWRKLLMEDERQAAQKVRTSGKGDESDYRCIYKLWPDFKVHALIDRSITTIKADAARRAFDAAGEGIVWAVLDSGIQADHPHFNVPASGHTLLGKEVMDLHRSFINIVDLKGNVPVDHGRLASPDIDPAIAPNDRDALIEKHRQSALSDHFGHGTHVSGILAGAAPLDDSKIHVFERKYTVDDSGTKAGQTYGTRSVKPARLTGVAPRCKLVSLKVLDHKGEGKVSAVIEALDYIREKLNDNPRMMKVHGVNMSLGYEFDAEMFACGQSPLCVEVNRLVQSGVVVVTAAGNTGYGTAQAQVGSTRVGLSNTINDPGNAEYAITVGSTHRDAPHTYGVSFFSSKGPTGDGRLKPDLVAPGERITSCAVGQKLSEVMDRAGIAPKDGPPACYVDDSGTSMAAPHVSGAVAAFLSIRQEFIGKPQDVKKILLDSAIELGRERYFEGHGLLDLMRAMQSV